jgi:hypothetical protein
MIPKVPTQTPRILYVCLRCYERTPEACGYLHEELRIAPNGEWLCMNCVEDDPVLRHKYLKEVPEYQPVEIPVVPKP